MKENKRMLITSQWWKKHSAEIVCTAKVCFILTTRDISVHIGIIYAVQYDFYINPDWSISTKSTDDDLRIYLNY